MWQLHGGHQPREKGRRGGGEEGWRGGGVEGRRGGGEEGRRRGGEEGRRGGGKEERRGKGEEERKQSKIIYWLIYHMQVYAQLWHVQLRPFQCP